MLKRSQKFAMILFQFQEPDANLSTASTPEQDFIRDVPYSPDQALTKEITDCSIYTRVLYKRVLTNIGRSHLLRKVLDSEKIENGYSMQPEIVEEIKCLRLMAGNHPSVVFPCPLSSLCFLLVYSGSFVLNLVSCDCQLIQ